MAVGNPGRQDATGSDTFSIPNEVRPLGAADDRAGHPYPRQRQLGQHVVLSLPQDVECEAGGEPEPVRKGEEGGDGEGEEESGEAEEDHT